MLKLRLLYREKFYLDIGFVGRIGGKGVSQLVNRSEFVGGMAR